MTPEIAPLVWAIAGLLLAGCILLIILLNRTSSGGQGRVQNSISNELRSAREESGRAARGLREEVSKNLESMSGMTSRTLNDLSELQKNQLQGVSSRIEALNKSNKTAIDELRGKIDERLTTLQQGNEKKLEEMRRTVDEKLHDTLAFRNPSMVCRKLATEIGLEI